MKKTKYMFSIYAGATPDSKNPDYWDGDIVWVTPADYKTSDKYITSGSKNITKAGYNASNTTIVPEGSIIVSKRAPIGTVSIAGVPLCTNQGCLSCVPLQDVNSTFAYYALSIMNNEMETLGAGTTFKEISAKAFANMKVPFFPLEEQHAIVRYLDSKCSAIDEAIERHKKIIEKLEEYELCVITDEINKSHGLQIRIKYIGDVQTGPFGTQLSASEYTEFGTPCINVKNIKNGYLAEDDLDRVPDAVLLRLPNHILHVGDIVFARKGSIDKHALVTLNEKGWMQGSDCIRLRPVNALPEYLNYALASNMVKNYLRSTATGSTMPSLTSDMIKELPVVIPSINIQQDIISRLDKIMTSIMKSKQKHDEIIGKLEEYRKSLIYNAVTGKIDCRTEAAR